MTTGNLLTLVGHQNLLKVLHGEFSKKKTQKKTKSMSRKNPVNLFKFLQFSTTEMLPIRTTCI